ncbi:MAG: ATP synthase F1 subunit delta [Fimbriimonadaceae bacterium]|jgi:F-type H+-transporting ATPase subunit delta|nr:ATP synthase F1 subunit delta [Fimbriimonadaceae bacterium]
MTETGVARRYAKALFNIAQREGLVASVDDDLRVIVSLYTSNARFRDFIHSPETGADQKRTLVDRVFGDRVTALTLQALRYLIDKRRDGEIYPIQLEFAELRRQLERVTKATITSAYPLSDDQKQAIIRKIEETDGNRKVEPEFHLDPSLIGGVKVIYDNLILDGSVKGTLEQLREKLVRDVLKQA